MIGRGVLEPESDGVGGEMLGSMCSFGVLQSGAKVHVVVRIGIERVVPIKPLSTAVVASLLGHVNLSSGRAAPVPLSASSIAVSK